MKAVVCAAYQASDMNRAALYCRLSKDDDQIGESTSISTQRLMLERHCQEHGFTIIDYYIDDGFSGLNYNRPAFGRMIEDIESGLIDIVITKDLSRLGRDYIMTGYFTDVFFCQKKVRYIAINDGIDTQRDNSDIAPFKNIMNDMYARDISRKIKSAKRQRAYRGMYISAQPPYGYRVDPQDHTRLTIDEPAAEIVRLIFALALEGNTLSGISRELVRRKIVTPGVYKALLGQSRFASSLLRSAEDRYRWNTCTLGAILRDPVYIGHMVNHKYEVVSYKTKQFRRVPDAERIVVEGTHEPIIDKATFQQVREILSSRHHPRRHEFDNWLQGRVFCADCQQPMSIQMRIHCGQKTPVYRCIRSYKFPDECSGYRQVKYAVLLDEAKACMAAAATEGEPLREMNRAQFRQRLDRIIVGKRKKDGSADIRVELQDIEPRKRRKGEMPWPRYW